MNKPLRIQFLVVESLLIYVGFAIAAFVSPPDIDSQIRAALILFVVTVPLSYWVVYKRGLPV